VGSKVDGFRIDGTPPGEGKQMPRQTRPASDGPFHPVQDPPPLLGTQVLFEEWQARREYREQVVEIVRDAAGELADRFHLLRLTKRFLSMLQPLWSRKRSVTSNIYAPIRPF
jgi:hypothetical protein